MLKQRLRAVFGLLWGLALFLAITWSLKLGFGDALTSKPALSQGVLKATLACVAVIVWKLMGRPLSEMGCARHAGGTGQSRVVRDRGNRDGRHVCRRDLARLRHPAAAQLSFLQLIALIWLLSSFSEEVYVRGLVKSWMEHPEYPLCSHPDWRPSIVASPCLFAAMNPHSCGRRWVSREVW